VLHLTIIIACDYWCHRLANLVESVSFSFDRVNNPWLFIWPPDKVTTILKSQKYNKNRQFPKLHVINEKQQCYGKNCGSEINGKLSRTSTILYVSRNNGTFQTLSVITDLPQAIHYDLKQSTDYSFSETSSLTAQPSTTGRADIVCGLITITNTSELQKVHINTVNTKENENK